MMLALSALIQEVPDIEEKLKNAPNDDYGTGVLIGNLIPFIILVIIAYTIYFYNKRRLKRDD